MNPEGRRMWIAVIDPAGADRPRKVKNWVGLLPPELTGGRDERTLLGWPRVVLLIDEPGGRYLHRFMADGTWVTDTWHETVDAAREQAAFEYEGLLSAWSEVPPDVEDPVALTLGLPSSDFR